MEIQKNIQLAPYTNFKIGGPADYFVEAKNTKEIREALVWAKKAQVFVYVLGGGTNVLVSDSGFRGLVLHVSCSTLHVEDGLIVADAGSTMGQVVAAAQKNGLTGMEWAVGLPGTVGGAIFGNAGCFGGETRNVVSSVALLDAKNQEVRMVNYELLEPAYRYTKLREMGDIVLAATFKLQQGSPENIAEGMAKIRQKAAARIKEQPLGVRTAGSTFKGVRLTPTVSDQFSTPNLDWQKGLNRAGFISAGWLLEQAGLKGFRIGDASFSSHHANFILNRGSATAADILALIQKAKAAVKEKFNIEIEEEIRYIGFA